MEYYSAIKKNSFESVLMRWMKLEPIIQSEVSQKDKKTFLSEQHREVEGSDKMVQTRNFFKKTGDIKGIFHARMGTIKVRNSKDLTEAKEIKKTLQGYTE